MKQFLIIIMTLVLFIALFIGCNPKSATGDDNPGTVLTDDPILGTWLFELPPIPPRLPDTITLVLKMQTEKQYSIQLLQRNEKTLFSSKGTWSSEQDSIILIGNECLFLDTLTDSLILMNQEECATPVTIAAPEDKSNWKIKTKDFKFVLSTLPIAKDVLDLLMDMIQLIPLTKQE